MKKEDGEKGKPLITLRQGIKLWKSCKSVFDSENKDLEKRKSGKKAAHDDAPANNRMRHLSDCD